MGLIPLGSYHFSGNLFHTHTLNSFTIFSAAIIIKWQDFKLVCGKLKLQINSDELVIDLYQKGKWSRRHPAPRDQLGLNIDEQDQIFLKSTLETKINHTIQMKTESMGPFIAPYFCLDLNLGPLAS